MKGFTMDRNQKIVLAATAAIAVGSSALFYAASKKAKNLAKNFNTNAELVVEIDPSAK